jgi:hypothetical protein
MTDRSAQPPLAPPGSCSRSDTNGIETSLGDDSPKPARAKGYSAFRDHDPRHACLRTHKRAIIRGALTDDYSRCGNVGLSALTAKGWIRPRRCESDEAGLERKTAREEGRNDSVARAGLRFTRFAPGTADNGTETLERPDLRHDAHPNHRLSGGVLDRTAQKNAAQPGRGKRSAHVGREHDDGQDKSNGNGSTGLASHCPFPLRRYRQQSLADSLCPCSLLKLPPDSINVKQNSLDERHSIAWWTVADP